VRGAAPYHCPSALLSVASVDLIQTYEEPQLQSCLVFPGVIFLGRNIMERQPQSLPTALVLRWDDQSIRVRCPFCLYSHRHSFARPPSDINQNQLGWQLRVPSHLRKRRSACIDTEVGGDYIFMFPIDLEAADLGYGWEVDRDESQFVTVNSQGAVPVPLNDCRDGRTLLPQYEAQHRLPALPDDLEDLVAEAENLDINEDQAEEPPTPPPRKTHEEILLELYNDPDFRREMYISHCCYAELPDLKLLCKRHPDDHLIGSVDEEGNTGSLLAATEEKGLDVLRWLQAKGDPITLPNHYGRTPLMEAALWGRLETVRYLFEQGVDLDALDANGMRAIDLAADTERNTKERTTRIGKVYRERPDAGRRRELIRVFLERASVPLTGSSGPVNVRQRRAFFDRRPDGSLDIIRPQELVRPPHGQQQKAFATLDRGPNYPYVNAMSGYTHKGWPNVLDNAEWTNKAELLRAHFGLPANRSLASHVEPQLLAYFLDRHSLFHFTNCDLRELYGARPPHSVQPVITISMKKVCDSCRTFIEHFQRHFPGFHVTFNCVGDMTPGFLQQVSI
jgi:hypothetical protein